MTAGYSFESFQLLSVIGKRILLLSKRSRSLQC